MNWILFLMNSSCSILYLLVWSFLKIQILVRTKAMLLHDINFLWNTTVWWAAMTSNSCWTLAHPCCRWYTWYRLSFLLLIFISINVKILMNIQTDINSWRASTIVNSLLSRSIMFRILTICIGILLSNILHTCLLTFNIVSQWWLSRNIVHTIRCRLLLYSHHRIIIWPFRFVHLYIDSNLILNYTKSNNT